MNASAHNTAGPADTAPTGKMPETGERKHRSWHFAALTLMIAAALLAAHDASGNPGYETAETIDGKPAFRVPQVESPITVDAVLDEGIWEQAVKIDANVEVRPSENVTAPVETEALLAYDRENLYVAIIAYDPEPEKIRAHMSDRDNINNNDEWVLILFDTFNDQRRSYDFMCNPLGVQSDFIESNNGGGEWDVIWDSAGRITDEGYVVEMAIPFSSMRFPAGGEEQVWGFDVVRSYPRSVRHHIGAFPRDRNNNNYFSQLIKLIGFEGVEPGKDIELDPTLSSGYSQERADETSGPFREKDRSFEPGITARWSMTPNMMLSATANPDFSQVEADAAQMDINTRFPLYYSERRPFFLEGADFFNSQLNLVHTRTLAEPDWGLKLTGKEGRHTIGFFSVRDQVTPLVFPGSTGAETTSLSMQSTGSVLRYKYDVGGNSNLGATLTDREGTGYHNRLASVDGSFKFTPRDEISFQAVGGNTGYTSGVADEFDQPADDFGGYAYHAGYYHNTEHVHLRGVHEAFSPDFRSDLGFETRAGYRFSELAGQYRWRGDSDHWFTYFGLFSAYRLRTDFSGNLLYRGIAGDVYYEGPLQSWIEIYASRELERFQDIEYPGNYFSMSGGIRPNGTTQLRLNSNVGDQIDYDNARAGKRFSLSPYVEKTLGRHVMLSLDHRFERMTVDAGRLYDANVSNFRIVYQFNRRAFVRLNLQNVNYDRNLANYLEDKRDDFDANTRSIFSQLLFSYTINPQTVFFLGYSDNYRNRNYTDDRGRYDDSITQTNRAIFTKIGYALLL